MANKWLEKQKQEESNSCFQLVYDEHANVMYVSIAFPVSYIELNFTIDKDGKIE